MVERFTVARSEMGDLAPALDALYAASETIALDFFVVGAAARDLLLQHVYGRSPLRATRDVDVAVSVRNWEEYQALLQELVDTHGYERFGPAHRIRRKHVRIDIIPFGPIAGKQSQIPWPSETFVLSTAGFQEAFDASIQVQIGDGPQIRVASLPGLAVLKLIAWNEAPNRRRQDPIDLCSILIAYHEIVEPRL